MILLQNATKNFLRNSSSNILNFTKEYALCLLISKGKKNCRAMALNLGLKETHVSGLLKNSIYEREALQKFFIALVNMASTAKNPGVIITDLTQITKLYGRKLEKCCYDYNSSMKLALKGLSLVTLVWTNGKIVIPLNFEVWIREKDLKNKIKYEKKTNFAKKLILDYKDKIPFKYIALDGEYGNEDFLRFLHDNDLKYVMRMPKNRLVTIDDKQCTLAKQDAFQLKRNSKYIKKRGSYKGIPAYFISHKRNGHNNTKDVVFIVSNLDLPTPKSYILAYELRWPIEKMFRTLKQHLGLKECYSNSFDKQSAHIFATLLAFTELEIQKITKRKKSPEAILHNLRVQNIAQINSEFVLGEGILM